MSQTATVLTVQLLVSSGIFSLVFNDFICFTQERSGSNDNLSFIIYISYLVYAPLYIAGPIISFNAYVSQVCYFLCIIIFAA